MDDLRAGACQESLRIWKRTASVARDWPKCEGHKTLDEIAAARSPGNAFADLIAEIVDDVDVRSLAAVEDVGAAGAVQDVGGVVADEVIGAEIAGCVDRSGAATSAASADGVHLAVSWGQRHRPFHRRAAGAVGKI
jgi:hypothetical protein